MAKILCLHGFGQSGLTLRQWTTDVVCAVNEIIPASFVFPTAHITLSTDNSKDFITIPSKLRKQESFAWNHSYLDWQRQFSGLPEAIAYLKTILEENGPFDGLVGFSQGAAYGIALASLLEDPSLADECGLPVINHPPFKFTVLYSGCKVSTFRFAPLYREIRTPTLLYYCIGDKIIPNRWSLALAANCTNIIVQTHREGHRVPLNKEMHKVVAGFIGGVMTASEDVTIDSSLLRSPLSQRNQVHRCASDWLNLVEETPFAVARL